MSLSKITASGKIESIIVRVRTDLQQFIKENVGQFRSLASSSE
ncbi:unnamed protein product, partial [Tenebrio molitor]